MMKFFVLFLMVTGFSASAFADCGFKVRTAAVKAAKGGKRSSVLSYDATARLVGATTNGWLRYGVVVKIESTNGYTDYLPSEKYLVLARGNGANCQVIKVTRVR